MADSPLNRAERALQHSFRKQQCFNGLVVFTTVLAVHFSIRSLPDRRAAPIAVLPISYEPACLPPPNGPLVLAGAWIVKVDDRRFGGLSALAIDRGRFLAVSDLGEVVRFDMPTAVAPRAAVQDLRKGPGRFGKKWARDAESLARDPHGRGWWVGYEQHHSLWLYDQGFERALSVIDLQVPKWRDNRGAEGLVVQKGRLLVLAENGRDALFVEQGGSRLLKLSSDSEISDAARAPDGSAWALLRSKGWRGIRQSVAPVEETPDGYRIGPAWPVPKGMFDNYEGLAIEALPDGRWRFWLITDDGHRIMARTLLVALDVNVPVRQDKGPALGAGPSQKPSGKTP